MQGITSLNMLPEIKRSDIGLGSDRAAQADARAPDVLTGPTDTAVDRIKQQYPQASERPKPVDEKAVQEMLDKVNFQMAVNSSNLRFKQDVDSGKMVVGIYDAKTDELIRQIPDESLLATAKKINEFLEHAKMQPATAEASLGILHDSQV